MEPPDSFHLLAAEGWIGLGNPVEAEAELAQIQPERQSDPDVLNVRWQLTAMAKRWDAGLELASTLVELAPDDPLGWVHRSYCLHELKRTVEARDNLLSVVDQFAEDPIIRYNLACYECQLGRLDHARRWLKISVKVGDAEKIKAMAAQDPDLKPLWDDIAGW
jgi:Flp pilus assembly protein TadD